MGAFFLQRINDHTQYLKNIKATLDGTGDFAGTDHHSCKLGRWLYSEGPREAARVGPVAADVFQAILEPHERFHEASAMALAHQRAGQSAEQEREVTQMHLLSSKLVDLLLELDRFASKLA